MGGQSLRRMLQGGDRRSIGKANQVAARILGNSSEFHQLIECLWDEDPIVRMRAADAAEKVSVRRSDLLQSFKAELLGLAHETTQAELRWHLALMIPRLSLNRTERERATAILQGFLDDRSSIVKTFAIQALADLAHGDPTREERVFELLQEICRTGTPAMKARSRNLLKRFQRKHDEAGKGNSKADVPRRESRRNPQREKPACLDEHPRRVTT